MRAGCDEQTCKLHCQNRLSLKNCQYTYQQFFGTSHREKWECIINWSEKDGSHDIDDDEGESSSDSNDSAVRTKKSYFKLPMGNGKFSRVCRDVFRYIV